MRRRPPGSTQSRSSAASDVYKRQQPSHACDRNGVRFAPRAQVAGAQQDGRSRPEERAYRSAPGRAGRRLPAVTITVGTSGWSYDHWDGVLYPHGLPAARRLETYTAEFATAELNASFYRWPPPARFARWRDRLPPGFLLSVKAPRGLTPVSYTHLRAH